MTPEVARDMIDWLTTRYGTDSQVTRWVDSINIWDVGSVNPDGAMWVFTHDANQRKNRHPGCNVDNNRNYPYAWGTCNGSSGFCSDETYRGVSPASEPETQAMIQLAGDTKPFFSLSYHSYGEYIMYSYGCTDPDEKPAMDGIAQGLNSILQNDSGITGQYRVGPVGSTIYLVDGGSVDTQYAQLGIYAYTIEVNSNGFQPAYATWRNITVQRQRTAWQWFLDKTLDGSQITGKITDFSTGLPIPATVSVSEVTFTHGEFPRTADAKGHYHWLAQDGFTYHVNYSYPGYCTETRTVTVGSGPSVVDVVLGHPSSPTSISAAPSGDNRIDLSWLDVPGTAEYRVYRSFTSGGPYDLVATVTAPQTSYSDLGVSGQVPYYYVVRAFDECESPNSNEVTATASGPCTAGPAFAGLSTVTDSGAATCGTQLAWSPAAGRCGGLVTYEVYRSLTSPFTPSSANRVASGITGTSYTDHAGLASGTDHFYIVRAVDSIGGGNDGNTVTKSAVPTGPPVVGTWTDGAGDTGTAKLTAASPWSVQPTGGYGNDQCAALTSPVVTLTTASTLSFASKYDIETDYDAGIVEVATGPTFTNWTKLTTVNYPDRLQFTGNACGYPTSGAATVFSRFVTTPVYPASPYTGSLTAFNNKQVQIRWRFSSDPGLTAKGWWIDDVSITQAMVPGVCSAGSAPNPKEVSPDGSEMRASRGTGTAIDVTYVPACGGLDDAAYFGTGPIAGALSWSGNVCGLGTTGHAVFDLGTPAPGSFFYFVVVAQNATAEGSYGQSWNGTSAIERPEAVGVGACDRPQALGGTCP
jgi:hypothetical protein